MNQESVSAKDSPASDRATYEKKDASTGAIVATGAAIAAGLAGSLLFCYWYVNREYAGDSAGTTRQTSFVEGPHERFSISLDREALARETQKHLDTYGWTDRSNSVVRIPISRAMELIVAESRETPSSSMQKEAK